MPGPIAAVESPSHPIRISLGGHDATVELARPDAALDRDFVLSVDVAGLDVPQAWLERDDDGQEAVAIGFYPRFADRPVPGELIFLVGRERPDGPLRPITCQGGSRAAPIGEGAIA